MRPLIFVWPYALIFWVIYVWAFTPEAAMVARASRTVGENNSKDSGSLRLIVFGMWIGLLLSFPIAFVKACPSGDLRWRLPLVC